MVNDGEGENTFMATKRDAVLGMGPQSNFSHESPVPDSHGSPCERRKLFVLVSLLFSSNEWRVKGTYNIAQDVSRCLIMKSPLSA
jgi:hypothetical protein